MKLYETWKKIMFEPKEFYQQLSSKIRYKEPTKFFLKIQAIYLGIIALLVLAFGSLIITLISLAGKKPEGATVGLGIMFLIVIILYPLLLIGSWISLHVGATLYHIFVLVFGGKEGYVETFKATAYSVAPAIFAWIPIVNYAAMVYVIVIGIFGIEQRQKLSMGKSVAVVLIPMGVMGILYGIMLFFFIILGSVL
jgi:hypothetical protein